MKKLGFILLLVVSLTSCKVWDPSMLASSKNPINPKLLTLDRRIEDFSNTMVKTSDDEIMLFTKEVEENLIDPYGEKYGYIALKRDIIKEKYSPVSMISIYTFGILNLLGMPVQKIEYKIDVELRIIDRNNKLIGKYGAIGESHEVSGLYRGYSPVSAKRKAFIDAMNKALFKIRPQIQADAEKLNQKLLEAGKL